MLDSKQLIEITGISRATLNNYVAMGILPSPEVRAPEGGSSRATRLGYFADETVKLIHQVQQLKKEGLTMAQIAAQLGQQRAGEVELAEASSALPPKSVRRSHQEKNLHRQQGPIASLSLTQDLEQVTGPAYMVNDSFELTWWNDAAEPLLFGARALDADQNSNNLLTLLLSCPVTDNAHQLGELLKPHVAAARRRMSQQALLKVYSALDSRQHTLLKQCLDETPMANSLPMQQLTAVLPRNVMGSKSATACDLTVGFYREGVLFIWQTSSQDDDSLLQQRIRRNQAAYELLGPGKPHLSRVAVLAASLQNAAEISAELPAEEYIALCNEIRQRSEAVFRRYHGIPGKQHGADHLYYFVPAPDSDYRLNAMECALGIRAQLQHISLEWQARKGWLNEIHLNIGLSEGEEWLGSVHAGDSIEFTSLGNSANQALAISELVRGGTVWVSKTLLNQLPQDARKRVTYGVTRKTLSQEAVFVSETFTTIQTLLEEVRMSESTPINCGDKNLKLLDAVPLTQIRSMENHHPGFPQG